MEMPKIGLGTWQLRDQAGIDVVAEAIELGYRHLDTAQMYNNEAEIGAGVRAAPVPRDQVYVVTKIHQDRFNDGTALESAHKSIEKMDIGAADLILCHWPPRNAEVEYVVELLEAARDAGLTRDIGISNFNVSQMERAAATGSILTNQVEFHPLLDQTRLLNAAKRTGMTLTAYMPIIRGEALTLPPVMEIAEETGANAAAVVLAWVLQQDVIALCNSTKRERLIGNLMAMDVTLSDEQMARISALTVANKRYADLADWSPDWDG